MMLRILSNTLLIIGLFTTCQTYVQETQPVWQPKENTLFTRWAADITPDNVHTEYPRPQMVREQWQNLNGLWDYAITPKDETLPDVFDSTILVPFPVESALSGVQKMLMPDEKLWYRRDFMLDESWNDQTVLLHFGAVDWQATVWVNGQKVGEHRGGYTPFSIDITGALADRKRAQEVVVEVWDPTDSSAYSVGKQALDPKGIWYTPTSGLWRTVWLEPVPVSHISRLKLIPDIDRSRLLTEVLASDATTATQVRAEALVDGQVKATVTGATDLPLLLPIDSARRWSPDDPFLYDLRVSLLDGEGKVIDEVVSYFGMRKISVGKGANGYNRLLLNNEPLFQLGPLDQGFWPGGLYTAPTDEALRYDVAMTKRMGFNMIRKHVKVEPDRWYYWCDKLGLLVWQDMPSGDERVEDGEEMDKDPEVAQQFETELQSLIDHYHNYPSIVMWVIFNEGWGQYDTERLTNWAMKYDTSRLVNAASGWIDTGAGQISDAHRYPGPGMPDVEEDRVAVLGEFGGQALALEDHLWVRDLAKAPDHFKTSKTPEALQEEYLKLIEQLPPLINQGLAAAVYTQTTDVESEVNGLMTYDREVIKIDTATLHSAHAPLYQTAQ